MDGYDSTKLASGSESEGYGLHTFSVDGDAAIKGQWMVTLNDARYGYMTFSKSGVT